MSDRMRIALLYVGFGSGCVGFSLALFIVGWTTTPLFLIAGVALLVIQVALQSRSLRGRK